MTDRQLDELSRDARELAMVRPIAEWRSEGADKPGQLAAFLDQVEGLDQGGVTKRSSTGATEETPDQ